MDYAEEVLRIDRLTAEFMHDITEREFRRFIRNRWVRVTRMAIVIAAIFYLVFAITDLMAMHETQGYFVVLSLRLAICGFGLTLAWLAPRYSDRLVDGTLPSLLVVVAMAAFLTLTFMRPYTVGWHGMAMMAMLFGVYVFIPNRYLPALLTGLVSSLVFLAVATLKFDMTLAEWARLFTLIAVTNILGAMTSFRMSRMLREEYREHVVLKEANLALHISYDERLRLEDALRQKAEVDEVTGVVNRSTFFENVEAMLNNVDTLPSPLSVLLLDVDYFRQINGTYGHLRSDEVLRALVSVCRSLLSEGQTIGRIGGEEFVMLLPGVALLEAGHLAERIREECMRTPVAMGDIDVHFTVSIAAVLYRPGEPFNATLRRADEGVAAAKFRGRNRIEVVA